MINCRWKVGFSGIYRCEEALGQPTTTSSMLITVNSMPSVKGEIMCGSGAFLKA